MSLILVFGVAALLVGVILGAPRWRAWRDAAAGRRPFPPEWRAILRRRVPLYRRLPAPLQAQVRRNVLVFLARKAFVGCAGLEITDDMRVTIAGHAALLRLNRGGPLFPELKRVLVYPGAFLVDRLQPAPGGVLREQRLALSGESWSQGQVILSWHDVVEGARVADDGRNVALHEFAHQLDQAAGGANGAPWLGDPRARARWAAVMNDEFAALQARIRRREAHRARLEAARSWTQPGPGAFAGAGTEAADEAASELIEDYGATNPAEFLAVVTEVFFERPAVLAERHPALFSVLRDFYRVDPAQW